MSSSDECGSGRDRRGTGREGKRTLVDHLLDGTRRVDFHGVEVLEPVYFRRFFRELLSECI